MNLNCNDLSTAIQMLCNKYHCKCEQSVDCAENEVLTFYVGNYFNRYWLYRVYLDDIRNIESFMHDAEKELDAYDLNKIDDVWKTLKCFEK